MISDEDLFKSLSSGEDKEEEERQQLQQMIIIALAADIEGHKSVAAIEQNI